MTDSQMTVHGYAEDRMKPCPFCGGGETRVDETGHWTGRSMQILSVNIKHWCNGGTVDGAFLTVRGRTAEEACARWNTRTSPTTRKE